jgi:hypothetical protein
MIEEEIQLIQMICLTSQGEVQLLELECATLGCVRDDVGERSSDESNSICLRGDSSRQVEVVPVILSCCRLELLVVSGHDQSR